MSLHSLQKNFVNKKQTKLRDPLSIEIEKAFMFNATEKIKRIKSISRDLLYETPLYNFIQEDASPPLNTGTSIKSFLYFRNNIQVSFNLLIVFLTKFGI